MVMSYVCLLIMVRFLPYTNYGFVNSSFYKVAMGEEASQINYLLLNVIRTYATRLTTMGILLNRDYQAVCFCFH